MNWLTSKFVEAESTIKQALVKSLQTEDELEQETTTGSSPLSSDPSRPRSRESSSLAIDSQLIEYIHNICQHPNTFTDFPLEATLASNSKNNNNNNNNYYKDEDGLILDNLSEWEERHARVILSK